MAGGLGTTAIPHDHVVHFYDSQAELIGEVARFVAEGFESGTPAVVIARPDLGEGVREDLRRRGLEAGPDRLRVIDAAAALEAFLVDRMPDRVRFRDVIGGVLDDVARDGGPIRAFGEMVALLWDDGNSAAAIALEGLWNEMCDERELNLYCAYPVSSLAGADDLRAATEICVRHSDVIAPPSYLTGDGKVDGETERSRVFVPTRTAPTGARRFVVEALNEWMLGHLTGDASIVIAELAANAILHAGSAFRVSVIRVGAKIRIAVEDADTNEPSRRTNGDGGFGMALIQGIASTNGLNVTPDGKTVWAYVGD